MSLDQNDNNEQYQFIRQFMEEMRDRLERWDDARLLLSSLEIPVSSGWDTTFKKISDLQESGKLKVFSYPRSRLKRVVENLNLASNKAVSVYEIEDEQTARKIADHLFKDLAINSRFAQAYPFKIPNDDLEGIDYEPYYCGEIVHDDIHYFPLGIKRDYSERVKINITEFEEEDRKKLEGYDKIIASKTEVAQFLDVVCVNIPRKRLEIRIDKANKTSRDDIENAREIIEALVFDQVSSLDSEIALSRINMFPLIQSLYDSDIGRICELAFECPNDSLHYEHLRTKDQDIRSEPFHDGGKKAVESVDSFRLAIEWEITFGEKTRKVEALLPGTRRMMRQPSPDLSYVVISRHIDALEINKTLDSILQQ